MKNFTKKLLNWHAQNPRPMPWKGERDPYKIWLSEIILQQTRVEQGLPYFLKFVEKYPTVGDLAAAPLDEVLKLWQGLGYYARCRNLHETARHVAQNLDGKFPETFDGLRKLKGVGEYTAAAIASFAYDLPHAVVDGNVFRVLSRVEGIEIPTDSTEGKRHFALRANDLIRNSQPAVFNQAIMDFGAMQCVPQSPDCSRCPMADICSAHLNNMVSVLPVKSKSIEKQRRFFVYFDFRWTENLEEKTFLRQRTGRDIWQGLYEFPMLESDALPNDSAVAAALATTHFFDGKLDLFLSAKLSRPFRQLLTHREIVAVFCKIELKNEANRHFLMDEHISTPFIELKNIYPLPKIIDSYLRDNFLLLDF